MDDFICDAQCDEDQAYYDWLERNLLNMTEEDWADMFNNEDYPEENIEDMPF